MVAFVDYDVADNDDIVLLHVGDFFLQFNRAKGFNSETREHLNKVVLIKWERTTGYSILLTGLSEQQSVSRDGITFEVCSLSFGSPDYADLGIYPTGSPSTCGTLLPPVPTAAPVESSTATPSQAIPFGPNDRCSRARLLSTTETYIGTTEGATIDDGEKTACTSIKSPGVWFTVRGTGGEMVANTCDSATGFDTVVSLFVGECGDLSCVKTNDDACGFQSAVSWPSIPDEEYKILVSGWSTFAGGTFGLTIQDTTQPSSSPSTVPTVAPSPLPSSMPTPWPTSENLFQPPSTSDVSTSNDRCADAKLISLGRHYGSTEGATVDHEESTECASFRSPGVWYTVIGTGGVLNVNTCDSDTNSETPLDTTVSVFDGNCGELRCIDSRDDTCGFFSSVTWSSEVGVEYKVLVYGFATNTGSFSLTLDDLPRVGQLSPHSRFPQLHLRGSGAAVLGGD